MFDAKKVIKLLEGLSGESALETSQYHNVLDFLDSHKDGLGYSQFNELLLLLGFDKVSPEFFDFLAIGGPNPQTNSTIQDTEHLEEAVTRFQKLALLAFGNLKFAYKQFSRDSDDLAAWLSFIAPINESRYANRRPPVLPLKDIPPADRYFLGYIVEQQLRARLHANPDDEEAKRSLAKRDTIVEDGKRNQVSYLTSDYLDVYVATSMRERHEFLAVAELTKAIFESDELRPLNLRYFDPTLAFCADRIDKGLSEALMLKRAKCTLFLAQETDTLGKDSELASTLAQGKTVIAYVPEGTDEMTDELIRSLQKAYPDRSRVDLMLEQLRFFGGELAWKDSKVRQWLENPPSDEKDVLAVLRKQVRKHYDGRAQNLREKHPLGIQVQLETGVAVGVLVVRNVKTCAQLIRRIMLGQNSFKISRIPEAGEPTHIVLKEELSGSIFRVMTCDKVLTHTFWNFYLR